MDEQKIEEVKVEVPAVVIEVPKVKKADDVTAKYVKLHAAAKHLLSEYKKRHSVRGLDHLRLPGLKELAVILKSLE